RAARSAAGAPVAGNMRSEEMDERKALILQAIVEQYIETAQPVGSQTVARSRRLGVSSATVRNDMTVLEREGYITQPHTSAGRIPTDKGYRFFVDTLLKYQPLENDQVAAIRNRLGALADDPKALVAAASQMLSSVTRLAGVVTLPRQSHAALSQIEFVPLSDNRVLAILVVNGREVQNRILQLERYYGADELRRASNYLNMEFRGKELSAVREHLVGQLKETREHLNEMMLDAIRLAQQVVNVPPVSAGRMEYVIAGETNLMNFAELSNVEKLRRLFDAFTQQRDILHLLDQSLRAEGVQIFIGQESGYTILDDCSIVTAPYSLDQEVVGVLGVIGPTRMAYERVIPIVDITAKLLGSALNSRA
ncbi:MAG TPA: heat-inducible transcriptional repressor HrcA, partial [Steroidobacteraceae bacterium]|nr:heat-inducible transcriptional repressor HrcA [Steroidobacteraceae bacterium]